MRGLVEHLRRHPGDAVVLARAAWRLRRRGWWWRWPFLPVPGRAYWRFRVATATGREDGRLGVEEVVRAARWSVSQKGRR